MPHERFASDIYVFSNSKDYTLTRFGAPQQMLVPPEVICGRYFPQFHPSKLTLAWN